LSDQSKEGLLRGGLASLGLAEPSIALFAQFRVDLLRFNRGQNLTSRRAPASQLDALLLECAASATLLPGAGPILDLGSGAGLPGIPVALMRPDRDMVLLERRGGRCDFLRREVVSLGLARTRVVERDASRVDPDDAGRFGAVLLKAVAPPQEALALARPYLSPDGRAILFRDAGWTPEPGILRTWTHHGPRSAGRGLGLSSPPVVHIFSGK